MTSKQFINALEDLEKYTQAARAKARDLLLKTFLNLQSENKALKKEPRQPKKIGNWPRNESKEPLGKTGKRSMPKL